MNARSSSLDSRTLARLNATDGIAHAASSAIPKFVPLAGPGTAPNFGIAENPRIGCVSDRAPTVLSRVHMAATPEGYEPETREAQGDGDRFLRPSLFDDEFLINRVRRDDLAGFARAYFSKIDSGTATVLDFGASNAPYRRLFGPARKFLAADLVDPAQPVPARVDVPVHPDGRLAAADASVDLVLSLQVLEHVKDVERYLAEAERILKPGGTLYLTTHGMWPFHSRPNDFHRWTLEGLRRLLATRFEIVDEEALMGAPAYALFIYLRLLASAGQVLNGAQSRVLNRFSRQTRWGKGATASRRIRNPWLYAGTVFFRVFGAPTNLAMLAVDRITSQSRKRGEAAVFRLVCKKKDHEKAR